MPFSIFLISPRTLHKTIGNERCERINVYISKDLITQNNLEFLNKFANMHITLDEENFGVINKFLANASQSDNQDDNENLIATTNALLFYLQSLKIDVKIEGENQGFHNIVKYINDNFRKNITIHSLCNQFFISKNSLFRLFRKNLQCTVIEYLLTLRLNHAKHLLTSTKKRVEEIAIDSGFNSANYFSLIFKNKVGVSPLEYRKKKDNEL